MRTDSIYRKLERADQKGGTTYFLDLMIFLEEATGDKYGKGAELVCGWGFKTSKTAIATGYGAACSLWQLGRAREFAKATETLSTFDAEKARVIAQQAFVMLSNPTFREEHPEIVLGFAKLEVEKAKTEATLRRLKMLEEREAKVSSKLQELRDPKKADDPATRQAILDVVDEAMGIKKKK